MDHSKILRRAWEITWRVRALWLFGFLFVLAGGGGRNFGNGGNGGGGGGRPSSGGGVPSLQGLPFNLEPNTLWAIGIGILAVVLLLIVVMTIVRYVTETAIIAGVDEVESTQERLTVRRGFRLGWSRQAWRLFLTDLLIGVPLFLAVILVLALAASPLLLLLTHDRVWSVVGVVLTVGLALIAILCIIAVALALSVVMPYIRRRLVLAHLGVRESIRQGVALVRGSLRDTGFMWLWLAGIGIVWGLVMIPVALMVVVIAVVVGGVPAGVAYVLSHSWIPAVAVGLPLFLLVLVPTLAFVEGLYQVYTSSAWTLAYREVTARYGGALS